MTALVVIGWLVILAVTLYASAAFLTMCFGAKLFGADIGWGAGLVMTAIAGVLWTVTFYTAPFQITFGAVGN